MTKVANLRKTLFESEHNDWGHFQGPTYINNVRFDAVIGDYLGRLSVAIIAQNKFVAIKELSRRSSWRYPDLSTNRRKAVALTYASKDWLDLQGIKGPIIHNLEG